MAKKLWRVHVYREQYQEIYVLAETNDEAVIDAIELAEGDPSCWDADGCDADAIPATTIPDYAEAWTGGAEGEWVSEVPAE